MELKIASWNIRGIGTKDKKDEVKKLIHDHKISICAILESHSKASDVDKVCNRVFGHWTWASNMATCSKGCRIILGWNNNDDVQVNALSISWQNIFYVVESTQQKIQVLLYHCVCC